MNSSHDLSHDNYGWIPHGLVRQSVALNHPQVKGVSLLPHLSFLKKLFLFTSRTVHPSLAMLLQTFARASLVASRSGPIPPPSPHHGTISHHFVERLSNLNLHNTPFPFHRLYCPTFRPTFRQFDRVIPALIPPPLVIRLIPHPLPSHRHRGSAPC